MAEIRTYSLEQKLHEVVFACPENTCKSTENKTTLQSTLKL